MIERLGNFKPMIIVLQPSGRVRLRIAGKDEITIDWGDGVVETKELNYPNDDWLEDDWWWTEYHEKIFGYNHTYPDNSLYIITLIGKNITHLYCDDNGIIDLFVGNNPTLRELHCQDNMLTRLDISNNTALTDLYCGYNKLKSLDISKNTALTTLYCNDNLLTSLDVSNNTELVQYKFQNIFFAE